MKKIYFYLMLTVAAISFAGYSFHSMLFNNQMPFTLKAEGIKLDKSKVYLISNNVSLASEDTLLLTYEQAGPILPPTLGMIYFDGVSKSFVLKTDKSIYDAGDETNIPENYFLPFALTLEDGGMFEKSVFFGPEEIVSEEVLIKRGIKFNSAVGDRKDRVSVKLFQYNDGLYLKTNCEGLGASYLVRSGNDNVYEVAFNKNVSLDVKNAFQFDQLVASNQSATYQIHVSPTSPFSLNHKVSNGDGETISTGNNKRFEVNGVVFDLQQKYTPLVTAFSLLCYLIIALFQFILLKVYFDEKQPPAKSLIAIRLLINNIFFLGVPIYLTSLYLTSNRPLFLVAMILLNLSAYIPVRYFTATFYKKTKNKAYFAILPFLQPIGYLTVVSISVCMVLFSANEVLFGIPIVHLQKGIVLLLIFLTQGSFLRGFSLKNNLREILRIGFILFCAAVLSLVTHDLGSIYYTAITFLLVELVRKRISIKRVMIGICGMAFIVAIAYNFTSQFGSSRKSYRVVAPYTRPNSTNLVKANQGDRETYSDLFFGLKNKIAGNTPQFNQLVIPGTMRSVSFSDFAMYWSVQIGGVYYIFAFFTIMLLLVNELCFVLMLSVRAVKINKTQSYTLPLSKESELVRFIIAFHIVVFTYPIASNLLILPITGQSIPTLAISVVEPIFLALFLLPVTGVLTNQKYVLDAKNSYSYNDLLRSKNYGIFVVSMIFIVAIAARAFSLKSMPKSLSWNKANVELDDDIMVPATPEATEKQELINAAKTVVQQDALIAVENIKKPYLKNYAAMYFSGKPYDFAFPKSSTFYNSVNKFQNQTSVDSIFSDKKQLVSGINQPFGNVFASTQTVNNKPVTIYSNKYYASLRSGVKSLNPDLTAELTLALERHLNKTRKSNIAAIMVVDNRNGNIVANSSMPLFASKNTNEIEYFAGSVKKLLVAYAALAIDFDFYSKQVYGSERRNFKEFVQWSDSEYAAELAKDLLLRYPEEFNDVLTKDFGLPLVSATQDSYFDNMPMEEDFNFLRNKKTLNQSTIFRCSIGQQRRHQTISLVEWYARVKSGKKVTVGYDNTSKSDEMSLGKTEREFLLEAFHGSLYGTSEMARKALVANGVSLNGIICKTGTAQAAKEDFVNGKEHNNGSSFVLSTEGYTIGVMLKGNISKNESTHAKAVFADIVPILVKYQILRKE